MDNVIFEDCEKDTNPKVFNNLGVKVEVPIVYSERLSHGKNFTSNTRLEDHVNLVISVRQL